MTTTNESELSCSEVTVSFQKDFEELLRVAPIAKAIAKADLRPLVMHHVHHNYKDRAQEVPSFIDPQYWLRVKASAASPFPIKLFHMLERVEEDGLQHIVSWQPHGRCFLIHKQNEFIRVILPRYMSLSKFASFQRQLNLYGFGRITQGLDKGGYYHEYLLRGKGPLALEVQRAKVKGTCVRGKANPLEEPNLWIMPWLPSSVSEDLEIAQNIGIAQQPSLLQPPTNALVDLFKAPSKLEYRSILQPVKDLMLPTRELSSKYPPNDLIATKRFQPQSTLQGNQLVTTTHFQRPYVSISKKDTFPSCRPPLTTFTEFASNVNPLSHSLDNHALGEYFDIEPLSPGASEEDDIILDKMDLIDMLERLKSL